jgi:RNA polymerase sigma-70 factor (ECF subfamily)
VSAEPLGALLDKLNAADAQGAEQMFWDYEPYLRLVVRRQLPGQLRAKFDSADVVQSVWAHVLPGLRAGRWRFGTAAELRAFLVTVARRRLTDRLRHFRAALERERSLEAGDPEGLPPSAGPRPSEVLQAGDLWEKMLALCPPEHHEVLRLKRQGLLLAEIAARTGLHEGSVRRVLRKLARQLAFAQGPAGALSGEGS